MLRSGASTSRFRTRTVRLIRIWSCSSNLKATRSSCLTSLRKRIPSGPRSRKRKGRGRSRGSREHGLTNLKPDLNYTKMKTSMLRKLELPQAQSRMLMDLDPREFLMEVRDMVK